MRISEKTARELGWPELVRKLEELCHTDSGRGLVAELAQRTLPADDVAPMLHRVGEARALHDAGSPLPFGSLWTLDEALARLDKEGALGGEALLRVAQTLRATDELRRFLRRRSEEAPALAAIAAGLTELPSVWGPISDAFDETGALSDDASPDLRRLRRRVSELRERLLRRIKRLLETPAIAKHLQDSFYTQREERYVLPIRAGSAREVPGIVLGSSASGATLFVEPQEVVALNNELKVAETAVLREEARILAELSRYVAEELPAIRENMEIVAQLDAIDARARLALRMQASCPRIADDGTAELLALRHPQMVLAGAMVVPNDLRLAPGQLLLVSGPNAGGKTVYLKAAGICALMLGAGLHLPVAPGSRLPLYEQVLTDVDDDQSIERNLSTFTAHIRNVLEHLRVAGPRALVLLDEVATGTDPAEGEALAQALLERLADSGTQGIVTTHYERLKALPLADQRFANASVGFDVAQLQPTYRVHPDLPGSSCALDVARRVGLPAELGARAQSLMVEESSSLARLLTELAGQRAALDAQREQLAVAETAARARERQHAERLESLRRKGHEQLQSATAEALAELRRARTELRQVRAELRRDAGRERLRRLGRHVDDAARRIRERAPEPPPEPGHDGPPVPPERLTAGVAVYVPRLGGIAEVVEVLARGQVAVRRGALRTVVAAEELRLPAKRERRAARRHAEPPQAPAPPPASAASQGAQRPVRTPETTLDARGMRVDEALAAVDRFVDDGLLQDREVLFILHGHGTGALRSAVREHLSHAPAVLDARAGQRDEGGDAVTVVWLR